MTNSRLGLEICGAALALGIVGDLLLRAAPWGLNVTLCVAGLVVAGAWLVRRHRVATSGDAPWIALTLLLLGAAVARRDAQLLRLIDVAALAFTLALALVSVHGVRVRSLGIVRYAWATLGTATGAIIGVFPLIGSDITWSELPPPRRLARAGALGLGVVLALPLLLVFGALFASADAVFSNVVANAVHLDVASAASHAILICVWGALAGGYLRTALLARQPGHWAEPLAGPSLSTVPVATALGLLNVLFLVFVVVQLRYFFGGAALVEATTGLTYAEYARRGFFELVTAGGLVLPVLLGADWALRDESATNKRTFRLLAGLLLVLLAVIMASALERMRLYVATFGLSEDRLYATAFMIYLLGVFGWFGWTVLRARRGRFAFGALALGFAVLAGLHVVNPDAFIVRTNLARPASERPFDAAYAASLSGDAVPLLVAALPRLPAAERCTTARALLARWGPSRSADWRNWNWGRATARRLVREHRRDLHSLLCPRSDTVRRPP